MPINQIETHSTRIAERQVLILLLSINAVMFCAEIIVGIMSQSTALIADSLDMFADAIVYGIALYADAMWEVGRSAIRIVVQVAQVQ